MARSLFLAGFLGSGEWKSGDLVVEKILQSQFSALIKVIESLTACACCCDHRCGVSQATGISVLERRRSFMHSVSSAIVVIHIKHDTRTYH